MNAFKGKSLLGNQGFGLFLGAMISIFLVLLAIYLPAYLAPVETISLQLSDPQENRLDILPDQKSFKLLANNSVKFVGIIFRCDTKNQKGHARTLSGGLEFNLQECGKLLEKVKNLENKTVTFIPFNLSINKGKVTYSLEN
jgi:hypothetical protein